MNTANLVSLGLVVVIVLGSMALRVGLAWLVRCIGMRKAVLA